MEIITIPLSDDIQRAELDASYANNILGNANKLFNEFEADYSRYKFLIAITFIAIVAFVFNLLLYSLGRLFSINQPESFYQGVVTTVIVAAICLVWFHIRTYMRTHDQCTKICLLAVQMNLFSQNMFEIEHFYFRRKEQKALEAKGFSKTTWQITSRNGDTIRIEKEFKNGDENIDVHTCFKSNSGFVHQSFQEITKQKIVRQLLSNKDKYQDFGACDIFFRNGKFILATSRETSEAEKFEIKFK